MTRCKAAPRGLPWGASKGASHVEKKIVFGNDRRGCWFLDRALVFAFRWHAPGHPGPYEKRWRARCAFVGGSNETLVAKNPNAAEFLGATGQPGLAGTGKIQS